MRIALCISGQPRGYREAYDYVKRNLLDHHQHIDIFMCSVFDRKRITKEKQDILGGILREVEVLYTPSCDHVEQMEINVDTAQDEEFFKRSLPDNPAYVSFPPVSAAMGFLGVYVANRMKMEHERLWDFRYDVVIRTRFDFAINKPFMFREHNGIPEQNKDKVFVPREPHLNELTCPALDRCNDQFAIGTSDVMDRYSNTTMNLFQAVSDGVPFIGEDLLQKNFHIEGLAGKLVYVDMHPPFPPGEFNGTPHSLVRTDTQFWKELYG